LLLAMPLLPRLGPVALSAYACATASGMLGIGAAVAGGRAAVAVPTGAEAAALAWLAVATPAAFVAWYWGLAAGSPLRRRSPAPPASRSDEPLATVRRPVPTGDKNQVSTRP
jgi:hypothetical protein